MNLSNPAAPNQPAEHQRTVAVVIAFTTGGDHALADAAAVATVFKDALEVSVADLTLRLDASAADLSRDLPTLIGNLNPADRFVLFYSGGTRHDAGTTYMSAWKGETTEDGPQVAPELCWETAVLAPLAASACASALLFLDPSPPLASADGSNGFDGSGIETFVRAAGNASVLLSCVAGESSFASARLGHGLWTSLLVQALRNDAPTSLAEPGVITDASLQAFLLAGVRQYLREETELQSRQTPTLLASGLPQVLARFVGSDKDDSGDGVLPEIDGLSLNLEAMWFRSAQYGAIKRMAGFDKKRGHFIPTAPSRQVDAFVSRLLAEEVQSESKEVYDRTKRLFNLRRRNLKRSVDEGNGTLDTEFFRMRWVGSQSQEAVTEYRLLRTVQLRVPPGELPASFDGLFPVQPDELVIPTRNVISFDDMVDLLEDLGEAHGLEVTEDEDSGQATLLLPSGGALTIDSQAGELIIRPHKHVGCLAMLAHAKRELEALSTAFAQSTARLAD